MTAGSVVASALVLMVLLSLVVFVAKESALLTDARIDEWVWSHPDRETAPVVLEDGRPFDEDEWEAVERAHSYLVANPEACVNDLLFDVRPLARCGRLSPRAWWADVVARGLAAETHVDLDAVRGGERRVPSRALRERASDLPGSPFGDAPAFRPAYAVSRVREGSAFGATLGEPFSVVDVDVDDRRVVVEGAGARAGFEVVDRDGDLAVAPVTDAYRREHVAGPPAQWFVDASNALEAVLPERFDALDAERSPWPSTDDARSDPECPGESVVAPTVHAPTVTEFDCSMNGRPGSAVEEADRTAGASTTGAEPPSADSATPENSRPLVEVTADDDSATLLVDEAGVVRFQSVAARRGRDRAWATRAVAAADRAVYVPR